MERHLSCGRRDALIRWIDLDYLCATLFRVVQVSGETLKMAMVDDTGVIRIACDRGVELRCGRADRRDKFLKSDIGNKDIIRGNAGLSAVDHLADHDALGCPRN